MHRALIVYNPHAGTRWKARQKTIQSLHAALRRAGIEASTVETGGRNAPPGSVFEHAGDADTVIACGGDGTVNEVLQGMIACKLRAALAVVPLGSGNLLARELAIGSLDSVAACLLETPPVRHPVAQIESLQRKEVRYWLAAAGVGLDAKVICDLSPRQKANFGIAAYYAEATRQLLLRRQTFPWFRAEFEADTGQARSERVTQVVAERIGYFGRCLEPADCGPLDPRALRVLLFKTAKRSAFVRYGAGLLAWQAAHRAARVPGIEVVRTRTLTCYPESAGARETLAEVDGELFGTIPVRLSVSEHSVPVIRPRVRPG